MASLFDFSQTISKLNKEKKFSETLSYFKNNKTQFTTEQIGLNKYILIKSYARKPITAVGRNATKSL